MNKKQPEINRPFPPIPRTTRKPSIQKAIPKVLSPQKRPVNKSA